MYKGIDVSRYQGTVDWKKVKASGVQFAMLRAGYGRFDSQKDAQFERNYKEAKAAGIPVGAYHYSYAKSVDDAREEAKVFLQWLEGKQFEYPLAFDVEEDAQSKKGKQFVSDIIRAFCEVVEQAGYYVCIYANKYWLENYIDDACKKKYDVWVANWTKNNTYNGTFGLWQYTSSGEISGISGRVDLDESYKDYPSIMQNKGLNGFKATAKPSAPFSPRMMVTLEKTPLYVSATAKKPAAYKSGTYYIYDGVEISGRYRITSTPERAQKQPIGDNVTGYVDKTDLK